MGRRRLALLIVLGIAVVVIAVTAATLEDNLTYYLYPSEAIEQKSDFPDGERFRLAGMVETASLVEDEEGRHFRVTDGAESVEVTLTGAPPPLFAEDVPVLLEGAWSGQVFQADSALIQHDENYEAPDEGGAYPST
jgi:cytochrome c-type biogenesis protein CcmE